MFQTPAIKSIQTTLPSSPRSSPSKKYIEHPYVLNIPKYENLLDEIYKNNVRFAKYTKQQEQENTRQLIKTSIIQKLGRDKKRKSFDERFNNHKKNYKINSIDVNLGETKLDRQERNRKIYFSNSSKVVILEQQCRLLQLFLQDQEKNKSNTQYLHNLEKTSQHRRPTMLECQKVHLKHSQKYYQKKKMMNHQKNDKLFQSAMISAKKNISYRRQDAYSSSLYVINEGFKNLLVSRQIVQDKHKQAVFNKLIKLFLHFAYCSEFQKVYYQYITKDQFSLLTQLFSRINSKINKKITEELINQIIQHKYVQVLHFQDFNELIQLLQQKTNSILVQQIQSKHPQIFKNKYQIERQKLNQNSLEVEKEQINKAFKKEKLNVAFKIMFDHQQSKLVANKFLSVKCILDIFKKYSIVPSIIWNQTVVMSCMWVQKRRQGLNIDQFLEAIVYAALSFEKWETFIKSLKQLNLGKLLLG